MDAEELLRKRQKIEEARMDERGGANTVVDPLTPSASRPSFPPPT